MTGLLYGLAGTAYKNGRQIKLKTTQPEWVINGIKWSVPPRRVPCPGA